MRPCLFTFIFVFLFATPAESQSDYYGPYRFEAASHQRIFSDTAYIRSAASPAASLQDTVFVFDEITVLAQDEARLTVGRKAAPWYKVRYRRNGKTADGYLWGGALALHADERDGAVFSFSMLSYPQPLTAADEGWTAGANYNTCVLKVRDKTGRIQQCSYSISTESQFFNLGYTDSTSIDNPFRPAGPLPAGGKFRLAYGMSGEACGIPSYEMGAVWDGKRLIRLPVLESGADAGAYSYGEEFVFPGQRGGKAGQLIVRNTAIEYAEDDGTGEDLKEAKRTVTLRAYRWDAGLGIFVKQP